MGCVHRGLLKEGLLYLHGGSVKLGEGLLIKYSSETAV